MFIRFFRSNQPSGFIFVSLIAIGIWALGFMEPSVVSVKHSMPLYELVASVLQPLPWLGTFIALLFVIGEAFLVNYIFNENEVLPKPSYLPALFYVLLISNNNSMLAFHPLLPANLFILLAIQRLLSSYRKDNAFSNAFDAGMFIAVATLFYFPYIVFFPLLGVALIILRPFNWREWVISFIGAVVPYFFVMVIYFWLGLLDYLLYDKMFFPIIREKLVMELPNSFYFLVILGWLILLMAFGKLILKMGTGPQKTKKGMILLIWFFIFSGLSVLIAPEISTKYFSALAIPGCLFYAFFFLTMKKEWLGEILFMLFFGVMLVNLVLHYF
jgi:hypothetical protein